MITPVPTECIPEDYEPYMDDDGLGFAIRHKKDWVNKPNLAHVLSGSMLCFDTVSKKLIVLKESIPGRSSS